MNAINVTVPRWNGLRSVVQAAVLLAAVIPCGPLWAYSELIIFGDSLSDTGNLASQSPFPLPFPYYQNRISNGPVAVDVLAASEGLSAEASLHLVSGSGGSNFAVAGAKAERNEEEDLQKQLQAHVDRVGRRAPADALYVVMIGGNDVQGARDEATEAEGETTVDDAVAQVQQVLSTLLQMGAHKLLVVNVPDIGRIPATLAEVAQDPDIADRATRLTRRFNDALHLAAASLQTQYPGKIIEFDLFLFINQILDNPEAYGFTHTEEGCFDDSGFPFSFHEDCTTLSGIDFDGFVFFDAVHPSARTHALIGDAMLANETFGDIDGDGNADALTDGLLLIRYLFGFQGPTLVADAVAPGATRSTEEIEGYIETHLQRYDIDGNEDVDALTDGILFIRYLFGFSGAALIDGVVGEGATRETAMEIEDYLRELVGS